MTQKLTPDESRQKFDKIFADLTRSLKIKDELARFWIFILGMFLIVGLWGWIHQINKGLGITGMRDYVSWGMYIGNFVFFVAVSLIGLLISSILHLLHFDWGKPISRVAETVAIAAVALAGLVIVMDMGRPDRFLNIFLHGRFASPIVWDVTVITTYVAISTLLFYLPLIPDLALLRDRLGDDVPKIQKKLYSVLSLGWKGNTRQFEIITHAVRIMLVLIIPVGLSIHTVTSWLFANTLRAGWDSTIFGPYFVSGAFVAGSAAVILVMYVYRQRYDLEEYFTDKSFDWMGKMLVLMCLVYLYFNINEYLVPAYKMRAAEGVHLRELFTGRWSGLFWFAQIGGIFLPVILLLFRYFRRPLPITIIAFITLVASWFKRFIIVIPTLEHPHLPIQNVPEHFVHYTPTRPEIMITLLPFFASAIIITMLAKLFPVVTMWEYAEHSGVDKKTMFEDSEK
ncbi:MAG TPA: polysulfide reductase NrfD [Bacteroidales bacterium]|nr:polysulfide reductase NrfD [Bacteroidales bacterium]